MRYTFVGMFLPEHLIKDILKPEDMDDTREAAYTLLQIVAEKLKDKQDEGKVLYEEDGE